VSTAAPAAEVPAETEPRVRRLARELTELEARLRLGGGKKRIDKQHADGKLTARERIGLLLDPRTRFQEIGLLVAYDR
jgi:3-methylcrotonyl-CoA carboxylase beta subunit